MITANASARNRSPFTATQWQELEHQALIFKYMVSGVPIPPDLIYSVKRSLDSASFSSRLFSHHPTGWGCFEMGFGRKVDPEPGRCRRTDGKKWRCSKEAYPDSKYCERHMHRGRNRSRKHVEVSSSSSSSSSSSLSSTTMTTTTLAPAQSPLSTTISSAQATPTNLSPSMSAIPTAISSYPHHHHHHHGHHGQLPSSSMLSEQQQQLSHHQHHHSSHQNSPLYPSYVYPDSSSSRPPDYGLSSQTNTSPYFCLKSEPYNTSPQSDKDYRYFHGAKEGMDELTFFPESSVNNPRGFPDSLMGYNRGYTQPQYQALADASKEPIKQSAEDQQHCFILGTDFKSERPTTNKASVKDQPHETQKPLHHFFGEWPPKNTNNADSWLDLASNSRVPNDG